MTRSLSNRARTALLVSVGTLLVQAAWVLVVPPFRGIDEFDHAYRAASVVNGHWVSESFPADGLIAWGQLIATDPSIVRAASPVCRTYDYVTEANCHAVRTSPGGLVLVASAAANYNPAYYAVVGWPALLLHGAQALYLMRIVSSMICLALVAVAAFAISTWARTTAPLIALCIALTPMALYSLSLPSPNGVEMAAAIALWAALLGLGRTEDVGQLRLMLLLATAATVPLVVPRLLGPLWWLAITGLSCLCLSRKRVRTIWSQARGPTMLFLSVGVIAGAGALAWSLLRTPNAVGQSATLTPLDATELNSPTLFVAHSMLWVLQSIAAFPTRNEYAPLYVYILELLLLIGWLAAVMILGSRRMRVMTTLVGVAGIALPVLATLRTYQLIGFAWQGRYTLPLTFGVVLVGGLALDKALEGRRLPRIVIFAPFVVLALAHVASVAEVLTREALTSPLAGSDEWLQPKISWIVLVTVLGVILWLTAAVLADTTRLGDRKPPPPGHSVAEHHADRGGS
ncbi:DUF2142 domain-containing protein [Nocardioides iriomotensis]|uniref:DUF2142 domain-containing protein n=1 Tax=Nocardioides iriomotensis TaxID=715784 RepID=UPI0013EE0840